MIYIIQICSWRLKIDFYESVIWLPSQYKVAKIHNSRIEKKKHDSSSLFQAPVHGVFFHRLGSPPPIWSGAGCSWALPISRGRFHLEIVHFSRFAGITIRLSLEAPARRSRSDMCTFLKKKCAAWEIWISFFLEDLDFLCWGLRPTSGWPGKNLNLGPLTPGDTRARSNAPRSV